MRLLKLIERIGQGEIYKREIIKKGRVSIGIVLLAFIVSLVGSSIIQYRHMQYYKEDVEK